MKPLFVKLHGFLLLNSPKVLNSSISLFFLFSGVPAIFWCWLISVVSSSSFYRWLWICWYYDEGWKEWWHGDKANSGHGFQVRIWACKTNSKLQGAQRHITKHLCWDWRKAWQSHISGLLSCKKVSQENGSPCSSMEKSHLHAIQVALQRLQENLNLTHQHGVRYFQCLILKVKPNTRVSSFRSWKTRKWCSPFFKLWRRGTMVKVVIFNTFLSFD